MKRNDYLNALSLYPCHVFWRNATYFWILYIWFIVLNSDGTPRISRCTSTISLSCVLVKVTNIWMHCLCFYAMCSDITPPISGWSISISMSRVLTRRAVFFSSTWPKIFDWNSQWQVHNWESSLSPFVLHYSDVSLFLIPRCFVEQTSGGMVSLSLWSWVLQLSA